VLIYARVTRKFERYFALEQLGHTARRVVDVGRLDDADDP
jgi:hypothetical protein